MKKLLTKGYNIFVGVKDNRLPFLFVNSPVMSGIYYALFSNKFRREQHAVLKGKVAHLRDLRINKANIYTLIRNTHRLEKGLLMRPRKPVFGLDYIGETVDAFVNIWEPNKIQTDAQYKWFYEVLEEYFTTSGPHQKVETLKSKFKNKVNGFRLDDSCTDKMKYIPYARQEQNKSNITYEEFYKLTKYRRSVRWFLNKPVPRELIDKAILAANQSPSACNRQPFEYRIIDDPDLLKEVTTLPMGIRGYEHNIPMLIVVVGNLGAYFDERDRHVIYIDASLANMSFMLALETLGVSSCSINWPDIEHLEMQMERILNLDRSQRPIMCMAVGFPDPIGKVAYSEKKSIEKFRKYN
ncbi:nitroreductase [Echinicola strongylocentroti]|uniref:Nitroreductase n=1 Tax=Echinicola strongylocentroti TaxID=1795355 RepID=A0A2Z4IP94_9BACT|nr:nitroreductase family protein [Echinicola strongylocentroti]AWW32580.1 nitroreductase [Echinicola strongylocentroti]